MVLNSFGAALAQGLDLALVGHGQRNGQALREKIVARVTGGNLHLVGFGAEADDVVRENDFSLHKS
jgi:hypothetical protein